MTDTMTNTETSRLDNAPYTFTRDPETGMWSHDYEGMDVLYAVADLGPSYPRTELATADAIVWALNQNLITEADISAFNIAIARTKNKHVPNHGPHDIASFLALSHVNRIIIVSRFLRHHLDMTVGKSAYEYPRWPTRLSFGECVNLADTTIKGRALGLLNSFLRRTLVKQAVDSISADKDSEELWPKEAVYAWLDDSEGWRYSHFARLVYDSIVSSIRDQEYLDSQMAASLEKIDNAHSLYELGDVSILRCAALLDNRALSLAGLSNFYTAIFTNSRFFEEFVEDCSNIDQGYAVRLFWDRVTACWGYRKYGAELVSHIAKEGAVLQKMECLAPGNWQEHSEMLSAWHEIRESRARALGVADPERWNAFVDTVEQIADELPDRKAFGRELSAKHDALLSGIDTVVNVVNLDSGQLHRLWDVVRKMADHYGEPQMDIFEHSSFPLQTFLEATHLPFNSEIPYLASTHLETARVLLARPDVPPQVLSFCIKRKELASTPSYLTLDLFNKIQAQSRSKKALQSLGKRDPIAP